MPKFLSGRNIPQWDNGPKLPPFQENERVQTDETLDSATGTVIEAGLHTSRVAFDDEDLEQLQYLPLGNNHLTSLGKHWRVGGR